MKSISLCKVFPNTFAVSPIFYKHSQLMLPVLLSLLQYCPVTMLNLLYQDDGHVLIVSLCFGNKVLTKAPHAFDCCGVFLKGVTDFPTYCPQNLLQMAR